MTTGRADGTLWYYPGRVDGKLDYGRQIGHGWGNFIAAFSPGDFNGDGRFDLVGVNQTGAAWGYYNTGKNSWSPAWSISGKLVYPELGYPILHA